MIVNPSGKAVEAPVTLSGTLICSIGGAPVFEDGKVTVAPGSFAVIRK